MESRCVLFKVGEDKDPDLVMLDYMLADLFFPNQHSRAVYNVAVESLAATLEHQDLSTLVFVGSSSTKTFGDYSPKEFAERVNHLFPAPLPLPKKSHQHYQEMSDRNKITKQRKLLVTDVYILNLFHGVVQQRHPPLGQKIATQLYKNGFINVRVHNVAYPQFSEGYQVHLGICLNTRSFVAQIAHPSKDRDVFNFLTGADVVTELAKPQHIFLPEQVHKSRVSCLDEPRRQLLHILESECKVTAKKWDKEHKLVTGHLRIIISQISAASEEDWLTIFKQARGLFDSYVAFGRASPKPGNRIKLLLQDSYEQEVTRRALAVHQHRSHTVFSEASQQHTAFAVGKDKEEQSKDASAMIVPTQQEERSHHISAQPTGSNPEAIQLFISATTPERESVTDHHVHQNILAIIRSQLQMLEESNRRLKTSCFASFFTKKIAVKADKIYALQTLAATTTYAEMKKNAEEAKKNKSVMAGFFSRKTRHLLELIVPTVPAPPKAKI